MQDNAHDPLITRQILLLFIGRAFAEATRAMTTVQIPIYLRELGASVGEIGLFFTLAMILPLLFRMLGGWMSDSIGRLRAMWWGSLAGIIAYLPYAFAKNWQLALLGPALLAIATALLIPSYRAHIADIVPNDRQGRIFGIGNAVVNLAWVVAPPLGGFLAQKYGYQAMFLSAILFYSVAAMLFWLLMRADVRVNGVTGAKPSFKSLRSSFGEIFPLAMAGGLFTWILITDGIQDIALDLSFNLMPIYLNDIAGIGKQSIGFMDGLHGIAWVVASPLGGWLADRVGARQGIMLGLGGLMLSPLIFALADNFWGFALSWIILGVGAAIFGPALDVLVARGVSKHLRGLAYAFVATSVGVISLPAPWIGSQFWLAFGPKAPFFFTSLLGILAIIPAWIRLRIPGNPAAVLDTENPNGPGSS
ncbi:MAG: MFS transporter [Anaerolineales bacterium]|nr:MAG: MFS transporter [Anaerolineales bacterium]